MEYLTVRQTLRLYARLSGFSGQIASPSAILQAISMGDLVDVKVKSLRYDGEEIMQLCWHLTYDHTTLSVLQILCWVCNIDMFEHILSLSIKNKCCKCV